MIPFELVFQTVLGQFRSAIKHHRFCLIILFYLSLNISHGQDTILENIINFENPIRSIAKDKEGFVYGQTSQGVFVLSDGKFIKSDFFASNFDRIIVYDGKLTTRKTLEKNKITYNSVNQNCDWHYLLPKSNSLSFCQIETDIFGQVWVSNGSKFLYCFKVYNLFQRSFPNFSIRGIENVDSQLIVLTYAGMYLNGNKWNDEVKYGSTNIFKNNNDCWFASTDMVYKLDVKTNQLIVVLDKQNSTEVGEISCVFVLGNKVYVGGFNGLFSINQSGKLFKENIGNEVHNVVLLQGKLFVCTGNGIYFLENNIFKKYAKFPSGLVYNDIQERFGKFYAASSSGIWMSEEGSPLSKNVFKRTLFENYECFSIEWDQFNNLWTGTSNGLVKYNINNGQMDVYLSDIEFNKRSSFKNKSMLYFGSTEGLFSFNTNNFSNEVYSFQTKEENIKLTNTNLFLFLVLLAVLSSIIFIVLFIKLKRKNINNATVLKDDKESAINMPPFTMENIEIYILSNINTVTAEILRENSGLSKSNFYKDFSRFYDITPKQLIVTIRQDHLRRKKNS